MKPKAIDIPNTPFVTLPQQQIPTHNPADETKKETVTPTRSQRVTIKKVLKTTKKPMKTKNRVTTAATTTAAPTTPKAPVPQTTKKSPIVTKSPIVNTTVLSVSPTSSQPLDPVGTDGVKVIYHCSFEKNENCRFLQDARDDLNWHVERDPSPSATSNGEGQAVRPALLKQKPPSEKHNIDLYFGRFAHLVLEDSPNQPSSGKARISTPIIDAPDGYVDLSFLYQIFNANPELLEGILNVFACNKQLIWSSSASWGNHWFKANIRITCNEGFRIIFEGVIGGVKIDIAIDDVAVTGPRKPDATTTMLVTTEDLTSANTDSDMTTATSSDSKPTLSIFPSPGVNDTDIDVDRKIDPATAVSLVAVSVGLFITTVVMLIVSLVIHARVCARRSRYPAHIIYHGPEYFNRGMDGDQTPYMTLNFRDGLSSRSGTGTEVLTLSDRHSGPTPIDRSSWEKVIMRDMKPVRQESKTFPIMKEIKHLLEAVHMRRIRTLSAHLSRAEVETLRRQFTPDTTHDDTQDMTQDSGTHDRTCSTVALERTQSSIRPLSEISEHFYYSLFPDPRTRPDRIRPDSGLSTLSHLGFENESAKQRDSGSRPTTGIYARSSRASSPRPRSSPSFVPRLSSTSRPRRHTRESMGTSPSDDDHSKEHAFDDVLTESPDEDIENVDKTNEENDNTMDSRTQSDDAVSLAPENTEMVENEIYEPYSGDVESDAQSNN